MSAKLDAIVAALDAQETSLGEILALVGNLRQQIKDGASPADLDRVLAEVQQNKGKIDEVLAEDAEPHTHVHPEGTVDNGDGTFTYPDGTIHNADGSVSA